MTREKAPVDRKDHTGAGLFWAVGIGTK